MRVRVGAAFHVVLLVTWLGLAIAAAIKGTESWAILALAFAAGMHFGRLIERR